MSDILASPILDIVKYPPPACATSKWLVGSAVPIPTLVVLKDKAESVPAASSIYLAEASAPSAADVNFYNVKYVLAIV